MYATGTAPLSYQWSRNGLPITDATDPTYTTPATTTGADNNAKFTVTVTNSAGTIASPVLGTLAVISQAGGNEGFQPVYPGCSTLPENCNPGDLVGIQYRFLVVENESLLDSHVAGWNGLYAPGAAAQGYNVGHFVDAGRWAYSNGECQTVQKISEPFTKATASLLIETTDYPYQSGQTSAVGSAMSTSDPATWPIQTYWADEITNLYQSRSESDFSINGIETLVTVERGGTLTDISSFLRCGIPMLPTTYRLWTMTTQMTGLPPVVNQVVVPDAAARYIAPFQASQFETEFQNNPGTFTVQYWDFAYIRESDPQWHPVSTFVTLSSYLGNGQDFGLHVVSVNGQDRVEFSNVPGNSYLPMNLQFAIAPPISFLASQTITFGSLSNVVLGAAPFAITATDSSGLAVSFNSTTPSVCTVLGSIVTVVAPGTCSIVANQAGSASYMAAIPVLQSFTVFPAGSGAPPIITPGGVIPVDGTVATIQPGEWVSIFGTSLANSTASWTGDFPQSLSGTSVAINGKNAYLSFVSPGQVNLQAPDDTAIGAVPVVVTTGSGSAATTVTLGRFGPSFFLLDAKHVAGIILRADGLGTFGGGSYDIIGPTGTSLGYPTVAAKTGDIVELFGTGFGPTDPAVPIGQAFSGAAPSIDPIGLLINGVRVTPTWAGLSGAGLDQINLIVPAGLGTGDVSLVATVGGVQTQAGVVISLQ